MAFVLRHRSPDDHGVWFNADARVGFADTRLSTLDLSTAGHKPMPSATGRCIISCNGEIYNHLEIRTRLQESGSAPNWRGDWDTKTLLAGFEAWGIEAAVQKTACLHLLFGTNTHARSRLPATELTKNHFITACKTALFTLLPNSKPFNVIETLAAI